MKHCQAEKRACMEQGRHAHPMKEYVGVVGRETLLSRENYEDT